MSTGAVPPQHKPSSLAQLLQSFRNTAYADLPPGPKLLPMRYVINIFKGLTFIWVLLLMFWSGNFSTGIKLYLLLHGSYGWFWIYKDLTHPDASFKQRATAMSLLLLAVVLVVYWVMPVTIVLGYGIQEPSQARILFCLATYTCGAVLMMGSDIQKTSTLARRSGLISSGFFARTRNPNYLGEMLIYGSFAACTGCWLSYAICLSIWASLFAINMYLKDQYSYKNKQGWQEYSRNSYMLLPRLFRTDFMNYVMYGAVMAVSWYYYNGLCCDDHGHQHGHHGHSHGL